MGLIVKKWRYKIALHWLRLRYWWLDTEAGKRAHVWAFVASLLLAVVLFMRMAVLAVVTPPEARQAIWPVWVVQLIIAVISAVISYALRPKIEPPKPAEATTPTVEDGRAVPEVHGTCWIEDEFILAHKVVGRVPIKTGGKK